MKFKYKKLLAIFVSTVLLLGTLSPALAFTEMEISGNGADSENEIEIKKVQETTVVQSNFAKIKNWVEVEVSSGDNKANENTGGDTTINTGSATANTNINNKVNLNVAKVDECGCCEEFIEAKITGNGSDSENEIELKSCCKTAVFQDNYAEIENKVDVEVESGDNEAEKNTNGNTTINTGPATANTNINNEANANRVKVGNDFGFGPSLILAEISGNGAKSENEIEISLKRETLVSQENFAWISNWVKAEVESGDNKANENTGGDTTINTGSATANTNINNKANFNFAKVECCEFDVFSKVAGNGADSENETEFKKTDLLAVYQNGDGDGYSSFESGVWTEVESGDNKAEQNTDPAENDPTTINTSPATANTNINNEGGLNLFNSKDSDWPDNWPTPPQFHFSFDFGEIWGVFFR